MTNTLSETDLRAISDQLGPQYAVVHCPPATLPWFSRDETAGIVPDGDGVRIVTINGPLSLDTRRELVAALVAGIIEDAS